MWQEQLCPLQHSFPPFICPSAQVPQAKRTVERFLFKLNEALAERGKAGVFWLGNLKHK